MTTTDRVEVQNNKQGLERSEQADGQYLDSIAKQSQTCTDKPCRIDLPRNVLSGGAGSAAESLQSFSYAYVSHSGLSSRMALIKRAIQFLREHSTEITESSSALKDFFVSHQQEVEPYTHALGIPFSSIQRNLSTASMTDFFSTLPRHQNDGVNEQGGLRGLLSLLENRHGPDTRRSLSQGIRPLSPKSSRTTLTYPEEAVMDVDVTPTASTVDATLGSPIKETAPKPQPKSRTTSWSESSEDEGDDEGLSFTPKHPSQQNLLPKIMDTLSHLKESSPRRSPSPFTKDTPTSVSPNNSDSSSIKRTRTLTNTSSLSLQSKLLDFLAEPFQDKALQPITRSATMMDISSAPESGRVVSGQRNGSASWLPSYVGDIQSPSTTPNLTSSKSTVGLGLLTGTIARYSATQVVISTADKAPYEVRAVNDVACLVFGVSRAELRNTSILNMATPDMREVLAEELTKALAKPSSVAICGMVIPVVKGNRQESLASIWVKRSQGVLIWVAEEVAGDIVDICVNKSRPEIIDTIGGDRNILFGQHDWSSYGEIRRDMLLRGDCDDDETENSHIAFNYTCKAGSYDYPCFVRRVGNVFKIASLPHMSGMVMIDSTTLQITDYNAFFVQYLFGYSCKNKSRVLVGAPISLLIPQMPNYIQDIKSNTEGLTPGMVYPEHFFRRLACTGEDKRMTFFSSIGIDGRHINGATLKIDCQLRVASTSQFSLWISFSRHIQEAHEIFSIPSQLPLLQNKNRSVDNDEGSGYLSSGSGSGSDSSSVSLNMHTRESSVTETVDSSLSPYPIETATRETSVDDEGLGESATTLSAAEITKLRHVTEIGKHKRDRKFSDYKIIKKMGEGAYGRVVLAQYPDDPPCLIVVKSVVKDRILVDTWVRDRKLGTVSSEIKILASLSQAPHPNIVSMVDFLEDDECYHIEMEAHGNPGVDLFDLIEMNPQMPENECRSIFKQIVSAVAHLHGLGIVHRDIKDENIILDSKGLLKLIDFGSAAYVKNGPFDVFVGTIDYAAPEVLSGNPYLGRPQDVWALGILLYTIVYKENPFYNVDEILEGELRVPFVMSNDCLDLIRIILNRDVNKRPTIEEIRDHKWLQEQ